MYIKSIEAFAIKSCAFARILVSAIIIFDNRIYGLYNIKVSQL